MTFPHNFVPLPSFSSAKSIFILESGFLSLNKEFNFASQPIQLIEEEKEQLISFLRGSRVSKLRSLSLSSSLTLKHIHTQARTHTKTHTLTHSLFKPSKAQKCLSFLQ